MDADELFPLGSGPLHETDLLTGLPSARAWPRLLAERLRAHPDRTWVAMLRIDDFAGYTTLHGEVASDLLVVDTAAAWGGVLRAGDVLTRFEGADFGCVVRAAELTSAFHVLGRLRAALGSGLTCSVALTQPAAGESAHAVAGRLRDGIDEAGVRGASRIAVLLPAVVAA